MTVSLYASSVGMYLRLLPLLSALLDKAAAHAKAEGVDVATLLEARLAPDMWSVTEQVRAVCNHATRGPARLAELPPPTYKGGDETTVAGVKARIAWTLDFLKGVDKAKIEGAGERNITFPAGDTQHTMSGERYFNTFSLPNFYFHLTTVYDILRHEGVPLAKEDFIGAVGA